MGCSRMSKTAVVFTCSHASPEVSNERFSWLGNFIYDLRPDYVVDLGDGADMKSLNSYDTRYPKQIVSQSYQADIECYNDAQERLRHMFKKNKRKRPAWYGFEGNHECFQAHTEIFTKDRGWVYAPDVTEDDVVMTLNGWEKVEKTHEFWHEGEMYSLQSWGNSFTVTPDHRIYYYGSSGKLMDKKAKDAPTWMDIPMSTEYEGKSGLTDDQLRYCAIALTDSYHNGEKVTFFQSGSKAEVFRNLLSRLGVEYREYARDRDIKEVCGKKLKSCQVAYEFHMVRPEWAPDQNKRIPAEFFELNEEQSRVFLEMLIFCDGSNFSDRDSCVFYGQKSICDDVQAFCQAHGHRASLSEYREGHWRVNINPRYKCRMKKELTAPIEDWVYCITVPSGNFLARQGNLSLFTGNCRIKKAIQLDPRLEGDRYGVSFSHLQTDHWFDEYHEYTNSAPTLYPYDGVYYGHYVASGNFGSAMSTKHHGYSLVEKLGCSVTVGHSHKFHYYHKPDSRPHPTNGLVAGCFKGAEESWAGQANNSWSKGVVVKRELANGNYDLSWVSLEALRKEYSK